MLEPGPLVPKRTQTKPALLSNQAYDLVKWLATVVLPGLGALYFALAKIWGFPAAEEVVGSIAALNIFFGLLLQVSSKTYQGEEIKVNGDAILTTDEGGVSTYSLNLNDDPELLPNGKIISFRVRRN